ncbi:hypothetical protein, partial [Enterococcus faecalis]|uniref:hypothetical protein n=1 Tax=Enterococcus faecalis TaxID=1351 RepID=UPI0039880AB8
MTVGFIKQQCAKPRESSVTAWEKQKPTKRHHKQQQQKPELTQKPMSPCQFYLYPLEFFLWHTLPATTLY